MASTNIPNTTASTEGRQTSLFDNVLSAIFRLSITVLAFLFGVSLPYFRAIDSFVWPFLPENPPDYLAVFVLSLEFAFEFAEIIFRRHKYCHAIFREALCGLVFALFSASFSLGFQVMQINNMQTNMQVLKFLAFLPLLLMSMPIGIIGVEAFTCIKEALQSDSPPSAAQAVGKSGRAGKVSQKLPLSINVSSMVVSINLPRKKCCKQQEGRK